MIPLLFYLLVVLGTVSFVARRPNVTIWWVAFYSAAVYSLPLTTGIDAFGRVIEQTVVAWMLILQLTLLFFALLDSREAPPLRVSRTTSVLPMVALAVSLLVFSTVVADAGLRIFQVHKLESNLNPILYIGWRVSASFSFLAGLLLGNRVVVATSFVVLGLTFLAGDRTAIGLVLIASLWAHMATNRVSWIRLLIGAIAVLFLGTLILFGKLLQAVILTNGAYSINDAFEFVASDFGQALSLTEPWATIGVFSSIVRSEIVAPVELFLSSFAQVLPVPSVFGLSSAAFNDFYQPLLFPGFRAQSLAYSFWGEAHAYFGRWGLVLFLVMYVAGLWGLSRLARSGNLAVRVFGYLGGAYWAFYIHRNSLASILAYERHILLYSVGVVIITTILVRAISASRAQGNC